MGDFVSAALGTYRASLDAGEGGSRDRSLAQKPTTATAGFASAKPQAASSTSDYIAHINQERRRAWAQEMHALTAYERHKRFISYYKKYNETSSDPYANLVTDYDILKQEHRFIRRKEDDENLDSWEKRMAKAYYDRLFKEYALVDLSKYKTGQIGMRWRTQDEVFSGKGQFTCASLKCDATQLKTFEVNFAYVEAGERKNALVKIRLCEECQKKMNYKKEKERRREAKRAEKRAKRREKKKEKRRKRKRKHSRSESSESSSYSDDSSSESSDESSSSSSHETKRSNKKATTAPPSKRVKTEAAEASNERNLAAPPVVDEKQLMEELFM